METRVNQIKKPNQSLRGWLVVFCGALFYMYQFFIRVSPNIMNDELMTRLAIDGATLGGIVGVYYWSYVAMQLPLGITMDRLGPRVFLYSASFICSFACYLFGNTTNLYVAGAARFLMGMGSACGLIGTIKLGTIWLEPKHIAKVTGITILMGTVGASLGGSPLKMILLKYGIETTMEYLAYFGIFIGIIIYLFVSEHPVLDHEHDLPDLYDNNNPITDILSIARKPQAWIIASYGMLMYIPITTMGIAWGVSFVERACGTTEIIAASVVSSMFLGAAIGSPMFALFSDFFKSRRIPMLVGSIITTSIWFSVLLIYDIPLSFMYVLFFVAGFAYTAKCLTFASICEIMPRNMSGVSIAFANMIVMTTGIIFHPLIGTLLKYTWAGEMVNNIPFYTEENFRFSLLVIPIFLSLSCLVLFFIKETHPENKLAKEYGPIIDTDVL